MFNTGQNLCSTDHFINWHRQVHRGGFLHQWWPEFDRKQFTTHYCWARALNTRFSPSTRTIWRFSQKVTHCILVMFWNLFTQYYLADFENVSGLLRSIILSSVSQHIINQVPVNVHYWIVIISHNFCYLLTCE